MKISTLYKKSVYHANHNEDDFLVEKDVYGKCIIAVMDGCSTAVESHWAAGFIKKILRSGIEDAKREGKTLTSDQLGEYLFRQVFEKSTKIKESLNLDEIELFSTLLIAVIDPKDKRYHLFQSGDGLYSVDGIHHVLDANNVPDFYAYHLDKSFKNFYNNHVVISKGKLEKRFLLATDGIEKMNTLKGEFSVDWLLNNGLLSTMQNKIVAQSLGNKYDSLRKEQGLYPLDDLTVVAIEMD